MATQLAEAPAVDPAVVAAANDGDGGSAVIEQDERDFEAEAWEQGWRPETEFKGDKAKWVDAKTFVERTETVMPLLKKHNHKLMAEITTLKGMIRKLQKSEQAAYTNALNDLKAKQEAAVETGDLNAHRAVSSQIEQLQKEVGTQSNANVSQEDIASAWNGFLEKHEWYERADLKGATDDDMARRLFADRTMRQMAQVEKFDQDHGPEAFMAEVERRVEERFGSGKTAAPRKIEAVAGVTRGGVSRTARTGANLPSEAKEQVRRLIRQGIYTGMTEPQAMDKFAKDFDWEGWKA